jgi:futalosine hydrolase
METGDILIAAAVAGEMEGLHRNLAGAETRRIAGQDITSGRIGQQAVRLVVTGPGIANTVHGLAVAVVSKVPALILQIGCGGGFSEAGLNIGDVAIASVEVDVQLGLEPGGPEAAVGRLPFPVIRKPDRAIFNCYPVDEKDSRHAEKTLRKVLADSTAKVFAGPFVTVATVTASVERAAALYRQHGALVENMEGAGAAHTAALYDIPFVEIRTVSNRVGERDKSRWDLPLAFRNCAQAVQAFLEHRPE